MSKSKNASPIIMATPIKPVTIQIPQNGEIVVDNVQQMNDTNIIEHEIDFAKEVRKSQLFEPSIFAYTPVFNDERKCFDIYKISIDPKDDRHELERIPLKHDSIARAYAEANQMYARDEIERNKTRR